MFTLATDYEADISDVPVLRPSQVIANSIAISFASNFLRLWDRGVFPKHVFVLFAHSWSSCNKRAEATLQHSKLNPPFQGAQEGTNVLLDYSSSVRFSGRNVSILIYSLFLNFQVKTNLQVAQSRWISARCRAVIQVTLLPMQLVPSLNIPYKYIFVANSLYPFWKISLLDWLIW